MSTTFQAVDPITGSGFGDPIAEMNQSEVGSRITRAAATAADFSTTSPTKRAAILRAIAAKVEASREKLIEVTMQETGLANGRLTGELSRTVFQIEQFAKMVESGDHYQAVIDLPDANWIPAARPDLRKSQQSIGLVAIFAASNFPYAFSVIGGDSVSALAAGCPVVVKAHPSHPNTCRIMHQAVVDGLAAEGISPDTFVMVEGLNPEITHWLAAAPEVTAIGFTGSGMVGKILIEISSKRPVPIPVFAEMGSLNPVFFTPAVLTEKATELAKSAIDSVLLGSGQFCTKPGILVIPSDASGDAFLLEVESYLSSLAVAPLLNKGIADRFRSAISQLSQQGSVKVIEGQASSSGFGVTPTLFIVDWKDATTNPQLLEEHFGPTTVIIRAEYRDFPAVAGGLEGQLTTALHATSTDAVVDLLRILGERSGRVIMNGFPTAVAVTAAMQHGGQWPASSSQTTSVGLDSIFRFLRPVAHQNFRDDVLPPALQNANPWGISRLVNGERSDSAI